MKPFFLAAFLYVSPGAILAHDVITTKITWTREISRIVNKRCVSCHGSSSSVPLSTYEEARPWAKSIRNQVLERSMPPWGAIKGVGDFKNDASLTALEIEMITQWVEGGAPKGDDIYLPSQASAPEASEGIAVPKWSHTVWPAKPLILSHKATLIALLPEAPLEAIAYLPDGSVQNLIWLRQNAQVPAYLLREPIPLPAGTRIIVTAASCRLALAPD